MFADDRAAFGTAPDFPYVATTYRLTEHFHFWTKHALINAILQPEEFIEIGEALAKEKGIEQGGWVRLSSKRGVIVCKAYVTKRIRPLMVDGKPTHVIGVPIHWGFTGQARKGYGANTLTPVRRRRQYADAGVQGVPGQCREDQRPRGLKEQLDGGSAVAGLHPRSASTLTPPSVRDHEQEVAKLIDVSRCIGCKACQAACMEWNNLREEVGYFEGTYDNPLDLDPSTWTLMRFTEWDDDARQSRMADPQGRLHALRGSGLPQGVPGARRDRAIRQRHRRLHQRELHRLRLLRQRLSVQHPADQPGRS